MAEEAQSSGGDNRKSEGTLRPMPIVAIYSTKYYSFRCYDLPALAKAIESETIEEIACGA
jgi:hypothetical protein